MSGQSDVPPSRPCPICGKAAIVPTSPFCSRRCADIDLHRWLSGVYAMPAGEQAEDEESVPRPSGEPRDD